MTSLSKRLIRPTEIRISFTQCIHLCRHHIHQEEACMYNNFDNLLSLPFTMFNQKPIIQVLILTSTALKPSSACSIYAGVDFFEFAIYLRIHFEVFQ